MNNNLRIAERLTILNELGNGILQRIYQLKKIYGGQQRPSFINDPQYAKVNATLIKKFPDFDPALEKTPGYELLTGKAKSYFEELEPHYLVLVDSFEYKEAVLPVLNEVASGTLELKLDENPMLTTSFLELFRTYVQVNLLLSTLEERKLVLAAFYKLYYFIKCINEPSYSKVANYLVLFENPIKIMQEEFKSLSASLGKTLINFMGLFSKLRSVPVLRKEGSINITLKPEDMQKPVTDKFHFQMQYSSQIYVWVVYGFLLCPETLALPGALDLCQAVLKDGYIAPIYRATTLPVHQEYENLFNNYKSKNLNLTKQKKSVKDVFADASIRGAFAKHREKRIYLRQELNSLYHLLTDKPGLVAPKFQMLLCALSMAKEEIFWYFRHLRAVTNKTMTKKISEEEVRDNRISELIYLVLEIVTIIKKYKKLVQQYYLEYLRGADLHRINELVDSNFLNQVGPGMSAICKSIIEALQGANPDTPDKHVDYKVLRLNWFRAESAFSSVQSSVTFMKISQAVDRFNLIINHTRFVDDIDGLLDQYASLRALYYWKDLVYEVLDKAIKDGPNQPLHAMAFVHLLAEFPANATIYTADEKDEIGKEVVAQSERLLTDITARIGALLNEVAKQYIIFDNQLADVNAAYPILLKKKDYRPPKDFVAPETPGEESVYKRRPQLDRLRLYQRNAWQLCSVLSTIESLVVYDSKFYPREFLRDKLVEIFRKFVRTAGVVETRDEKHVERNIQRPSVLEKQLQAYTSVARLVENFVDLDINELIRDVWLSEMWVPGVGKSNTFDWATTEETDFKYETTLGGAKLIGNIVGWYADFVAKKLAIPGVCYSINRQGFVSRTGLAFRAELYADLEELKSLARLIGPYGIKLIDREVLKFILSSASSFKDLLSHNKQALDELAAGYHNENTCNEALKKFKDIDSVVNKSIAIGNALYFRDTLHEALRQTIEEKTPFIHDGVQTMFKQYKPNTYLAPDLLQSDALAYEAGVGMRTSDQALKKLLGRAFIGSDLQLVNLLPYLYAASFTSMAWRDAQYKPLIEAHNNNQHAVARCIDALTINLMAVVSSSKDEKEIIQLQRVFVEVSSVILLRLARATTKNEKVYPIDFSSVITFMDRFVQESTVLTQDVLEGSLPYTLLRNHWKSIFAPKLTKKTQEVTSVDVF